MREMKNTLIKSLLFIGGAGILSMMVMSFFRPLWVDPSVILTEMERISEGYVPYSQMHLNYPPFWFYLMAGLKHLFNVPNGCYHFYLAVHYLFSLGCAFLVFGLSKKFGANTYLALAAGWFYMFLSMWLWGDCVIFDIPTAFWGLLACYLALCWRDRRSFAFILIGIICSLSFLTKQFGAGFLPLVLWLILTDDGKNRIAKSGFFVIGYLVPLVICLMVWGQDIVDSVLLNGYGSADFRALAGDKTTNAGRYIRGMFYICTRFPMIPLAVVALPFAWKHDKWREVLFCLFGACGFALQICFITINSVTISSKALHYLLLLAPFIAIMTSVLATMKNKVISILLTCCLFVTCSYSAYKLVKCSIPEYFNTEERNKQEMLAKEVGRIVGENETAWVVDGDLEFLYFKADLTPGAIKNVAYSTGFFEITADEAMEEVKDVDYVISYDWPGPSEYWRGFYSPEVQSYVESFPKTLLGGYKDSDVVIYCLKNHD